jgi:inner membrane protein
MDDFFASVPLWAVFFTVGVVLLALEMVSLTFDLLWLGLGALAGALLAWMIPAAPSWIAVLVSVTTALILMVLGRRWAKRQRSVNRYIPSADALVGQSALVIRAIHPPQLGLIKSGNETWSATAGQALEIGQHVIIKSRSATVVTVERS